MSKQLVRAVYVGLMAILCVSSSIAQSDRDAAIAAGGDKYVISAKAGGINYVEGTVAIVRKDGKSGYLTKRDSIEIGDRVSTGADGRAEILLNPGSYLRLAPNSAFEFKTTSLDELQIRLDSGSAIFEVFAANEFKVTVIAPNAKLFLVESGVFRVDVNRSTGTRLEVWEGKAQLDDSSATLLKDGRAATLNNKTSAVAKFDRGYKDSFELWSKERSKLLAKNISKLKNRDLRTQLMRSFLGRQWGMYNSFGLWIFDASLGGYCFLPFGYGWSSPYGYGYGNSLWWYDLPWIVYSPPSHWGGSGGGSGNGSGNGSGSTSNPTLTPLVTAGDRSPVPPFVRMGGFDNPNGGGRGNGGGVFDSGSSSGNNNGSSGSSYTPPPASSAPASTTRDSAPMTKKDN